ncbi:MAG: hypothetical protein QF473_27520 [Planctomycetota bacterium]|jgi:hypothetical protein|nr:hypothetical protein [Planctomycetota bacterium]
MIATPENVTVIGDGLDHPESLCIDPEGVIYAGGEAGQIYRISPDGDQQKPQDSEVSANPAPEGRKQTPQKGHFRPFGLRGYRNPSS